MLVYYYNKETTGKRQKIISIPIKHKQQFKKILRDKIY